MKIKNKFYPVKSAGNLPKSLAILVSLCLFLSPTAAQTVDDVLLEIEQNNTILLSLKQYSEAEKIRNKTGIYLENPEVEFHYLWGNNSTVGNRTDFSASQNFDFPTAYHFKRKIAEEKNLRADLQYQIRRKEVLLEAKQTYIELIYMNAYFRELENRYRHAKQITGAYQSKFDKGESGILDLNKAKLNLLNAQKELNTLQSNREKLKMELARLNGGKTIGVESADYRPEPLPADFDQWYATAKSGNLELQYLQQETEISKKSEQLQRSMNLPKFSAGYMSEKTLGSTYQGVTVGVSVPLWENKNTVRQIKAQTLAGEVAENDAGIRFYNQCRTLYNKAAKLQEIAAGYKTGMEAVNSSDLLKKALDAGEISLIEYILELTIYYEAVNNILESERNYQSTVAEMKQWEL